MPRILLPLRSLPSQLKGVSLAAATAVGGMVSVVLYPELPDVNARAESLNCDAVDFFEAGQAVPDLLEACGRRSQTPSLRAWSRIWGALPPSRMIRPMASVTGSTSYMPTRPL